MTFNWNNKGCQQAINYNFFQQKKKQL